LHNKCKKYQPTALNIEFLQQETQAVG